MANYKRLCQEAYDHMLNDPRLFTDQVYWDAYNMEILCHVLGINVIPLFKEHNMLTIASVWLGWKRNQANRNDLVPRTEWETYSNHNGIWEFERISTFPELARKLKGSRHIKVLKELALYELEQREKEGEDECS